MTNQEENTEKKVKPLYFSTFNDTFFLNVPHFHFALVLTNYAFCLGQTSDS